MGNGKGKAARKRYSRMISLLLTLILVCSVPVSAEDEYVTVTFSPQYGQTEARKMLDRINAFRTGADAWYWNADDTTKTICTGLGILEYDYALESIAMQRAAEIAISYSHTRPDGGSCFDAIMTTDYDWYAVGENIAAGYENENAVFAGWREDNCSFSGQGHRRNMLSKDFNRIGIGHVYYKGIHFWAQEFARSPSAITATSAVDTEKATGITLQRSSISSLTGKMSQTSISMEEKESAILPDVTWVLRHAGCWTYAKSADVTFPTAPTWQIEDESIVSISGNTITGLKAGTTRAKISALTTGCTVDIVVTPPVQSILPVGKKVTDQATGITYQVTGYADEKTPEVKLTGISGKKSTVSLPASVILKGISCKVVSIGDNAFKGKASLKSVTIGKNVMTIGNNAFNGCKALTTVTGGAAVSKIGEKAFYKCTALKKITLEAKVKTIGKSAFYGCKNLKTIVIKSKLLKASAIGTKAFTGTFAKPTVKVPSSKLKTYKKALQSKGLSKKAVYKKL